ncbi:uncharacterized protein [Drosophila kikkawai]|uniref:Uncharacterized protein isoform X1 n=1 Tax=Drosophila kikkawai TaxID=30033 RepID=A0A6P4JCA9_DROKI|nr:uncharacterized protein LOC108081975 [Drosophila kikkawai]
MYRSTVNQQEVRGQGSPAVPQNGPFVYGSGIVFSGNVYPMLIDGVPVQPPAGAHQAAAQQRMQMEQRLQGSHPNPTQTSPESLPSQRAYQRIDAAEGTSYIAKQTQPQNHRAFGRFPGAAAPAAAPTMTQQQPLYNNHAVIQRQQQLRQEQQLAAMAGSYGSCNFNYNQQPSAGGDFFGSWTGYSMMQPSEANKPFQLG